MTGSAGKTVATDVSEGEEHELSLHAGEAIYRFANTYPTLLLTITEAVQNAVDADATRVFVGIDFMDHHAVICDNGTGVTVIKFRKALTSVAKGIKKPGSLGQFGLGLVSPINKCQSMRFFSKPQGESKVNSWTFIGTDIKKELKPTIPYLLIDEFPVLPVPFTNSANEARRDLNERIEWQTMVLLEQLTSDEVIGLVDVDELSAYIQEKLGIGMRRKNTTVYLKLRDRKGRITKRKIDPLVYRGEPLAVVTYQGDDVGKVEFALYRSRLVAGERQGKVIALPAGEDYPITAAEMRIQALGARLTGKKGFAETKDGLDALCSGYFEGTITAEKVALNEDRTKFELNDALREFYFLIGYWLDDVGKNFVNDEREKRAERRYQDLGEKSLESLLSQLRDNAALARLAQQLNGMLPPAKADPPEKKSKETEGEKKDRKPPTSRRVVAKPREPREGSERSSMPSFITFAYEMLYGSSRLWEYDADTGVLTFNIRHPLWAKVDETEGKHLARHDQQVMRLQEWLAFKVLKLLAKHDEDTSFELRRIPIDEEVGDYIELFVLPRRS